jgi:hypothetical protein
MNELKYAGAELPHSAIGNKAPIELIERSAAHGLP